MSIQELQRWMAFDRISPIGDERFDLMIAQLTATMVNLTPRKEKKTYRPIDFMPYAPKPKKSVALSQEIRRQFMANTKKA